MGNITVGRYDHPEQVGYRGWIEPQDRAWIAYVRLDGTPLVFLDRDPATGEVK